MMRPKNYAFSKRNMRFEISKREKTIPRIVETEKQVCLAKRMFVAAHYFGHKKRQTLRPRPSGIARARAKKNNNSAKSVGRFSALGMLRNAPMPSLVVHGRFCASSTFTKWSFRMKKRTFLTCACLVATLTAFVVGAVQVNAGELGNQIISWSNKWPEKADRPGGPADVFIMQRSAKINDYSTAVNNATIERANEIGKAASTFADKLSKSDNAEELEEARVEFTEARSKADRTWTKAEEDAYDTLLKEIRDAYRTALNSRANEFRKARLTITRSFKLDAESPSKPFGGRKHDKIKGTIIYQKVQEGKKDQKGNIPWRFEWEVADHNDYNANRQRIRGDIGELSSKDVWPVSDGKNIGIGFYFRIWGPGEYQYFHRHSHNRVSGDLKCTFKLTEKACVEQARRELWNITDDELDERGSDEKGIEKNKLLEKVNFKRVAPPK